ncbi:MAG TPA: PKD domain-containing protein, partial [Bacteroidia bacterium]|nr:PKD domain-containing protein [Bacteroidia bacterium]
FTGLDACCPILASSNASNGCPNPPSSGICPLIGMPPPYNYVSYISPYSGFYPISSNPSVQINPHTGHISGTPNITGQWVVGVCVKEYRNGVLIGTHLRDFQFNVTNCQNLILSTIQQQSQQCGGLTVQFNNLSSGGVGYTWNFGDPATLADTSNLQNPSYTYPDTGKYIITLINHGPNPACNDTSKQTFYVYPLLNPSFAAPPGQCIVGNSFNFSAGGQFAPYSSFNWNFTSAATPGSSTQQNPNGVTYNQYGNFPVSLTVTEKNCSKTVTDTITVYPNTVAQFHIDSAKGCQPLSVTFTNTSVYGTGESFVWNFGDGNTSTTQNPTHIYQNSGTYNISLVVTTTTGCVGTSSVNVNGLVNVYPGPKAGFTANPTHTNIYYPEITFTDTSKNVITQVVTMGDGTTLGSIPPQYTYNGFGTFVVTQIAGSSNGCSDTARQTIYIDPDYTFYIPNTFTPNGDIHNEVFKAIAFGITDFSMVIYDRWGVEIFNSSDVEKGWDGKYKNTKCPEDVYVYKIEYTPLTDPYPRKITGHINLIR